MKRKLAFSAVAGRKKKVERGACQDAVFGKSLGGTSCVALADGAGSKKLSGTGSRRIVRIVVDLVLNEFNHLFDQVSDGDLSKAKALILTSIVQELSSEKLARRGKLSDYACTLLFAAADNDRLLLGHLGDGMIFSVDDASIEIASLPDNGEFANETFFVTDKDALQSFRLTAETLTTPKSILLASDGAAESLLRRADQTVAPAVGKLCEWTMSRPRKEMNAILRSNLEGMFREKTADDCSIAILADPRLEI